MNRSRLTAILLCGALLTAFSGCAASTERGQTKTESLSLAGTESVERAEDAVSHSRSAVIGISAAPTTEAQTAEKEEVPEIDRKPVTDPETDGPIPQTSVQMRTTAAFTPPTTSRTPEPSAWLTTSRSPETSPSPATTPDVPSVPETTEKPAPATTQTPETEPPATTRPPETQPHQPSRPPEPENPVPDTERMARMFLELLNAERAKVGARPLATGDRLRQMAQVRADELTVLFDHDRPSGESSRTVYTEFEYGNCYDYSALGFGIVYYPTHYGEDIGQTAVSEGGTAEEAVLNMMEGFRGSPGHWSDLMNPAYGAAGVAVTVARIDMGDGFPALYRCYFEVLLVDRLYE